jgi:delta14-sterol reductase
MNGNTKLLILGFFTPWAAYAVITLLHFILPARKVKGYVKNDQTGEVLSYRLNGIPVLIGSILIWFLLGRFNVVPFDWLYQVRWASAAGALVMGLIFSFIIVLRSPSAGKPFLADFWFGRLKNPQFKNGYIDAKMWLYLIGAVMLQLNILSFVAHHWLAYKGVNPGYLMGTGLLIWFIWEYLTFERVYLYTYDFIAERVGFKLGFGCLSFYPYFYSVSLWSTVNLPNPERPVLFTVLLAVIFFAGWMTSRGANLQKYYFKIAPDKSFLGIKPVAISDGNHSLLVSGFWGASRHINYLGEILMACGIALSAGYPDVLAVWLYPLYYAFLLGTRAVDDGKVCKAKYGALWDEYTKKVKYRIIPFIW